MAENKKVNLKLSEARDILKHIITNNRFLQKDGKKLNAVELQGGSGIGKTSLVLQVAKELGLELVKVNLAQIEELGDLTGFPLKQFQMCRIEDANPVIKKRLVKKEVTEEKKVRASVKDANGVLSVVEKVMPIKVIKEVEEEYVEELQESSCIWVDETATTDKVANGYTFTGQKRMGYCPPEWVADKGEGYILLLDDFNRADLRFMNGVMEILDRQEYISWSLPKDWHVILTSNPDNEDYFVQSLDQAQKSRYLSFNIKFDIEDWAEWAEKEGIDTRCINFLLLHPELVTNKSNPRSVVSFFNVISSIPDFSKQLDLVQMLGEASVGPEFSSLFVSFINNRLDKLITPKEMLDIKDDEVLSRKLSECVGKDEQYRPDIASILNTRLINYTLNFAENNPVDKRIIDRCIFLATENILGSDLQYVLVKKLLNGNKQKFQKMMVNESVVAMTLK